LPGERRRVGSQVAPLMARRPARICRYLLGGLRFGLVAAEHREPGPEVAQRDGQVDNAAVIKDQRPARARLQHTTVGELHKLAGVLGPGWGQEGRSPASSARSAIRAERFDERTATNVAPANTSVPMEVPQAAQSVIIAERNARYGPGPCLVPQRGPQGSPVPWLPKRLRRIRGSAVLDTEPGTGELRPSA